jgi:hypothetical protein
MSAWAGQPGDGSRDEQGERLYSVSIRGEVGEGLDTSPHAIDRDHVEFARRCEEPGWRRPSRSSCSCPTGAPCRA